jgi:transposase InsO family protein
MNSITQDMKYRQSLINYAEKYGVSKASRKYNKARSYIYFWLERYDGTLESLACQSRKPHTHPRIHTETELKLIRDVRKRNPNLGILEFWHHLRKNGYTRPIGSLYRVMRRLGYFQTDQPKKKYVPKPMEQMQHPGQRVQIDVKFVPLSCITTKGERYYQFTAIDEYSRLRYLEAFEENSTYSAACFLKNAAAFFKKHGFYIECVQTDNGFEFTNRFSQSNRTLPTLFEATAASLGIRHKLIRPYTPRHNGKVERSHREDQKRFYSCHRFYSFQDFSNQLKTYLRRSNSIPMRPLRYLSPLEFLAA